MHNTREAISVITPISSCLSKTFPNCYYAYGIKNCQKKPLFFPFFILLSNSFICSLLCPWKAMVLLGHRTPRLWFPEMLIVHLRQPRANAEITASALLFGHTNEACQKGMETWVRNGSSQHRQVVSRKKLSEWHLVLTGERKCPVGFRSTI